MVKHFKNFPSELEQYNPEVFDLAQNKLETRDFEGELHSYNDKPSLVTIKDELVRSLTWHSHGEIYREGDYPSRILFVEDRYETRTSKLRLHSHGDFPAIITYRPHEDEFWVEWYRNGHNHRENGLPSLIIKSPQGMTSFYHINGWRHRDGGLPAWVAPQVKAWYFLNRIHNSFGPAELGSNNRKKWYLFGAQITEEAFNSISTFRRTTNSPLWVAFLVGMGMTSEENVQSLMSSTGKWDSNLPINWILRSLNVTSKSMSKTMKDLHKVDSTFQMDDRLSTVSYPEEKSDFSDFIRIASFLEHNISFAQEEQLEVKPSYEF